MRIRCSNLRVTFHADGKPVEALQDVSFETSEGEFLAIVGPSGCGKSTLLRTLAGLIPSPEGAVERLPRTDQPRILMVFQENSLFPWKTVLENATFGLRMQGVGREERRRMAGEMLARFGLGGREGSYPSQLSVGMKQRVAIVRSFLSRPDVLLMDEPFGALDAQTRLRLQQELLEFWEEHRHHVIFVTHDVDEALLLSDRVLVMSDHPGTIASEHVVPFPRPRDPGVEMSQEFLALKHEILSELGLPLGRKVYAR